MSAAEIERLIRGMNPWPSAYTKLNGKTVKIWKARVMALIGGDLFAALPGQDPKKHAGEIWAADESADTGQRSPDLSQAIPSSPVRKLHQPCMPLDRANTRTDIHSRTARCHRFLSEASQSVFW